MTTDKRADVIVDVVDALEKLDGSTRTAVALLLGIDPEELDELGGVEEDHPTPKLDWERRTKEAEYHAEHAQKRAQELDTLISDFVDRWENLWGNL